MHWPGVHALVQQARQGDRQAMDRLVVLAGPFLLRQAQAHLGPGWPDRSISDLTQLTWVRAWGSIASFTGGDDDANTGALFRAWLARIMKNVWLNDLRRRPPLQTVGPDGSTGPPAPDPSPSAHARRDEQRALVRQALDRLPEADRQVVRLRFDEELSYREIGQRLGLDESTVRYHLNRVLRDLADRLEGLR